jgi:hypothetical protein
MKKKDAPEGNCFVCGVRLDKIKMEKHVVEEHARQEDGEQAVLVQIEDWDKQYWLYLDIEADASLNDLDLFLRHIWLECCGHMSAFAEDNPDGGRPNQVGITKKIRDISPETTLRYIYDMGSSTELTISIIGESRRPKQKEAVRLIARNVPPKLTCNCGKPAVAVCGLCLHSPANPFLCGACAKKHDHYDTQLPITNSPRIGECAYCGKDDRWTFDPKKFGVK